MRDPAPIRQQINDAIGELIDFNQRVVTVLRSQIKDFETVAMFFEQQKQRVYSIINFIEELTMVAASNTGDILLAEFGIPDRSDDDEEEDDEDEDS